MYRACFILAFIISSCTPFQDRQILNNVETIISVHPDSALTVLQGMHPHNFPFLHTRQLHALLQSEALDKCYIDITDDSLARYANSYFGDHGTYLHRLKSWYYLGRIYFNAGNYAESVIYYNKALDYAESLQNFHYLGLVNREIANAYEHVWDSTHSIEYIKKAIESFERADEIKYVLYCKLTLARLLRIQKNNTASLEAAKWIIENTDDNYLLASANEHIALLSLSDSDCNIAQVQSFLSKAGIGTELPTNVARLCNLAIMYQKANKPDSADYYIAAATKLKSSANDSITVYFSKYRIAKAREEHQKAIEYLEQYLDLQDPAIYKVLDQSVSFYQSSYYHNESRINAMKARLRTIQYGLVIVVLFILALFLVIRNRRQKERIIEEMSRISDIQQELSAVQSEKQSMSNAIATLFNNRFCILQTLSEQYELLEEKHQTRRRERGMELSRDDIIDSFKSKMRDLRKDKDINISMEAILDSWKSDIMVKFRSVFGQIRTNSHHMTDEDFELATYFFSGMKYKTISFLTGHSEQSLRTRKTRLKQRIQALDNTFEKEKALFLNNL